MDYKFRNKKGITLIALVLTIIILLILAGITLAGIFGKQRNLKSSYKSQRTNRNCKWKRTNKVSI